MDRLLGAAADSPMNVPLTSGGNLSPYLNFDPGFLAGQSPEYILMEGVDSKKGVSHYCYQVGLPVLLGAGGGTVEGAVLGWQQALRAAGAGRERRALFLNAVRDQVKVRCQPLGAVATIFSLAQFTAGQLRDTQDELTYVVCGTVTGAVYKSTAGLRSAARGGAIGLALSATFCLANSLYKNNSDITYRIKKLFST